jgi:hypothetical protein
MDFSQPIFSERAGTELFLAQLMFVFSGKLGKPVPELEFYCALHSRWRIGKRQPMNFMQGVTA